jgi:hypothetical protein
MREDFSASAVSGWEENAVEAPLKVRFGEEGDANAFAQHLAGVPGVQIEADGEAWEVGVDGAKTGRFVVQVLEAVRQALAGKTDAYALVSLDGREYRLEGD